MQERQDRTDGQAADRTSGKEEGDLAGQSSDTRHIDGAEGTDRPADAQGPAGPGDTEETQTLDRLTWHTGLVLVLVGVVSGFLSGMFGIGGGSIIVPALVWVGLSQRHASATSLASMIPMSISGVVSYALGGHVDWVAAILLALGTVIGAQIGTWLLDKLPEVILRWAYVVFLLCVIVQQLLTTPSRNHAIQMSPGVGLAIVIVGVLIGILSGLLGVGGGAIAVPALSMLGASDLIARGTSLLAILPSSLSGTVSNMRHHLVHLLNGMILGMVAAVTTPLGTWAASQVSARMGSNLFALYLCLIVARCIWAALKVTPAFRKRFMATK